MRGTVGIHSVLLQPGYTPGIQLIGYTDSHSGMILVTAYSLYLYTLPIQKETVIRIKKDTADPKRGIVAIHRFTVGYDIRM